MAQMSVGSTNGDNGRTPGTRFVRAEIDEELRALSHGVQDGAAAVDAAAAAAAASDLRSRPTINGQPVQPSARPDIDPTARRRLKPQIRPVSRSTNTDTPKDAAEASVKTIEETTEETTEGPAPDPVPAPRAEAHPEGHNPWEAAAEALRELARGDQAEDLLDVICFLEGRPLTELVEAVLRGYFSGRAGDEAVQAVVKARREYTPT